MLNNDLLDLLVCPETKQDLSLANESSVEHLNEKIDARELRFVNDSLIEENLDGLLVRSDGLIGYGIFENIPNLLIAEGISLAKN